MSGMPPGWVAVNAGSLFEYVTSGSRGWAEHYAVAGASFIRIGNLKDGAIDLDLSNVQHVLPPTGAEGERTKLRPGDILISITAELGRVALVPEGIGDSYINQHVALARPHPGLSNEYLAWQLAGPGRQALNRQRRGATKAGLGLDDVRGLELALPPLAEQRRIVAKLDAIFEKTRTNKARLERLPALLEKLKRSILAAAFRGDLTADWRAANPNAEPASVLLDRIRADRRRRWEAGLRAKGKDPAKATYHEPRPVDPTEVPELPAGWAWTPFEGVVENFDGVRVPITSSERSPGPFPYYGASGIIDHVSDFLLDGEFLLIAEDGANLLSRRTPIAFRANGRFWVNNHAHVVRPVADIDVGFLEGFVESRDLSFVVTGTAQPKLTQAALNRIPVAIAPSQEQGAISRRLADCIAAMAALRQRVEQCLSRVEKVERASLAKAFRGELVSQDQSDEPALVLLERIRAARAVEPGRPRRSRSARADESPPASGDGYPTNRTNSHGSAFAPGELTDLVVAAFQAAPRLTAPAIAAATSLDLGLIKKVLEALVESGQVSVHGKARGTTYEWTA